MLTDRFGRDHTYLRISVTDRCNYRCVYCMPPEGLTWMPRDELLSFEEIGRLVGVFAQLGIRKIRLTGGEPTLRADITQLIQATADVPGIDDLAMTTNGHTLPLLAPRLADAGLKRINVSLDSLDPDVFATLTRGGDLRRVLLGIEAAHEAGLGPIKINCVILKGQNDHEVPRLIEYFSQWAGNTSLRFIEYMPFQDRWHQNVPNHELRDRLRGHYTLHPLPAPANGGPARTWRIAETGLTVGFISPLSEHFCASCNRLRLGTDGHLRTCLAHEDTPSLRDLLRGGASDEQLADAIRHMVLGKPEGHDCQTDGGTPFEGVMTSVGG